jgi:hypothetical protein
MDQKERAAGTADVETRAAEAPAERPMVQSGGDFLLRRPKPEQVVRRDTSKVS